MNNHPAHQTVYPPPLVAQTQSLGRHVLAEFYDCDSNILNNQALIESYMVEAAVQCGATVIESKFHQFNPYGVSGVVIISESHLAIHAWPEYGYAAIDLFTCGDSCNPLVAYEFLRQQLHAGNATYTELRRGHMDTITRTLSKEPFQIREERANGPVWEGV